MVARLTPSVRATVMITEDNNLLPGNINLPQTALTLTSNQGYILGGNAQPVVASTLTLASPLGIGGTDINGVNAETDEGNPNGASGGNTVRNTLAEQKIVGTPDMTPTAITAEAKKAHLDTSKIAIPSCSVAGKTVNSGSSARCFAQYMTIHALEATGGQLYSQMPRYASANGKGTNDAKTAPLLLAPPQALT